jgi:hypothetical protein
MTHTITALLFLTKEVDKSEVRRYLNDAVKKGLLAKGENTTFVYFDGKET